MSPEVVPELAEGVGLPEELVRAVAHQVFLLLEVVAHPVTLGIRLASGMMVHPYPVVV